MLEDLGLDDNVTVLQARALKPTESADIVRKAFDTAQIAERYRAFLDRWDRPDPLPGAVDDLARQLFLFGDWLQVLRRDPLLPAEHLPPDWPAIRAETVFRQPRLTVRADRRGHRRRGRSTRCRYGRP